MSSCAGSVNCAPVAFDPTDLAPAALAALLEAGSFVLVEDEKGKLVRTTSGILVDAPPDECRAVIEDYAGYKSWMPQLTRSELVSRKGGASDVAFTLSFRFSVFSKSLDYDLRYKSKGDARIEWERIGGDFEESYGAWSWIPLDRAKRTAVFYSFYVDLGGAGSMVKLALKASPQMEVAISSSTAILVARSFKARVEG